jgi:glycosyltransferase involved in cell wall biosynthesis
LGIEPVIAALGEAPPSAAMQIRGLAKTKFYFFRCRLEWMRDPWADVTRSGAWLRALAKEVRPWIIHLNSYAHAALGWNTPVLVVAHSCVFSWFHAVKARAPSSRWQTYRQAVRQGLQAADGVTAPTKAMLAQLKEYYGGFHALPAIPTGRRAEDFMPGAKVPVILSAGRLWDEAKNVTALASIAADLPWPVVLAGERKHPEGGWAHFKNVYLAGQLIPWQLSAWFSRAAIYALPALYEPFGLSALEAALAGCALVLGDIASLRENWDGAALFVPPRNTAQLRRALNLLIHNAHLRQTLSQKARQRALGLTADKMAHGYMCAYRLLAMRHHNSQKHASADQVDERDIRSRAG